MKIVGRVHSVWRYPVKSMRGEELSQAFAGYGGIYGDRCYAFFSSGSVDGFPYLTGRQMETMLLYAPAYRHTEQMRLPPNLTQAEALTATPVYPDDSGLQVDVRIPAGELLAIDDPHLIDSLRQGLRDKHQLTLRRSHRAMTDCRPISLFSLQTRQQLSQEVGAHLDLRRFRANVYLDLEGQTGFAENDFMGQTLRIGSRAEIAVVERDRRCKMITLDPDTGEANPEVMRVVARAHDGTAGLYGVVLVEGTIFPGDAVAILPP
jgi:uncharacterized protein YcbX